MKPEKVYKRYQKEVAKAEEVLKQAAGEAASAFATTCAKATNEYVQSLDAAVASFRKAAR